MREAKLKSVLVVDASTDIRMLLDIIIQRLGFKACIVQTIAEAKHLIEKHEFDVLISDIGISDEACDQLVTSARVRKPDMPVIIFADPYHYPFSSQLRDDNCFSVDRFNFKQLTEVLKIIFADTSSVDTIK